MSSYIDKYHHPRILGLECIPGELPTGVIPSLCPEDVIKFRPGIIADFERDIRAFKRREPFIVLDYQFMVLVVHEFSYWIAPDWEVLPQNKLPIGLEYNDIIVGVLVDSRIKPLLRLARRGEKSTVSLP